VPLVPAVCGAALMSTKLRLSTVVAGVVADGTWSARSTHPLMVILSPAFERLCPLDVCEPAGEVVCAAARLAAARHTATAVVPNRSVVLMLPPRTRLMRFVNQGFVP
jgi:hypothetical protein